MSPRVVGPRRSAGTRVREVEFLRDKYGPELLVDVGWIDELEKFNTDTTPHRLHFYDILLVTRGLGRLDIDGRPRTVEPGRLLFTSPGQVRRFEVDELAGICLFFTGDFVQDFFNDPLFLFRLQFFHRDALDDSLAADSARAAWLVERLECMRAELRGLRGDSSHLLRAILYEVLVTLNRWFAQERGTEADTLANATVYRFLGLLEERFESEHRVAGYARELGVTPGHLSHLTRRTLGIGALELIHNRLLTEARRRLLYSDKPACEIALELGFTDPSYFGRFFARGTGKSPKRFRNAREPLLPTMRTHSRPLRRRRPALPSTR